MAKPTVAIRIEGALYEELLKIAEARDVTVTQALNIYIRRQTRVEEVVKTVEKPVEKVVFKEKEVVKLRKLSEDERKQLINLKSRGLSGRLALIKLLDDFGL